MYEAWESNVLKKFSHVNFQNFSLGYRFDYGSSLVCVYGIRKGSELIDPIVLSLFVRKTFPSLNFFNDYFME